MAIDTSIYGQAQSTNPFNSLLQAATAMRSFQADDRQNKIADLVLQDRQRTVDRENGKNKLLKELPPGTTSEQLSAAFRNNGYLNEADQVDTAIQNRNKSAAAEQKDRSEAFAKFMGVGHELLGRVVANPSPAFATAALDAFENYGKTLKFDVSSDVAAQRQLLANLQTPDQIKQWAAGHAVATKELLPKTETRNTGATTEKLAVDPVTGQVQIVNTVKNTQSPDSVAADRRAAADRAAADRRAREQIAQGKVPSGYRQNPDGTLVAIPGGPADPSNKAPTEFQGKSAAFGARAEQADKILTGLHAAGPTGFGLVASDRPGAIKGAVEAVPLIGGGLGTLVNTLPSELGGPNSNQQRAEQAQRDFVNAVLRQESGAAIGASEFDNARKQYFPQPGDSAAVIQQKAANRKLAIQGLQNNAGHAAFSAPAAAPPQSTGLPSGWKVEVH